MEPFALLTFHHHPRFLPSVVKHQEAVIRRVDATGGDLWWGRGASCKSQEDELLIGRVFKWDSLLMNGAVVGVKFQLELHGILNNCMQISDCALSPFFH